jgi:hypothetical protein
MDPQAGRARTAQDLFEQLVAGLTTALTAYEGDTKTHGRAGAILAIKAVLDFLSAFAASHPDEEMRSLLARLDAPLLRLGMALHGLGDGIVDPMLRWRGGGKVSLPARLLARAAAAAALHCLMMAEAKPDLADASRAVAGRIRGGADNHIFEGRRDGTTPAAAITRWRFNLMEAKDRPALDDLARRQDHPPVDVAYFDHFTGHARRMKDSGQWDDAALIATLPRHAA